MWSALVGGSTLAQETGSARNAISPLWGWERHSEVLFGLAVPGLVD